MKGLIKITILFILSFSAISMNNQTALRRISVLHYDGNTKYLDLYSDTSWDELQNLMLNMFPDYRECSASCSREQIDWQIEEPERQREIIGHIYDMGTEIILSKRSYTGHRVIIEQLFQKINNEPLERIFWMSFACDVCLCDPTDDNKATVFPCGCCYCRACFNRLFNDFLAGKTPNCWNHQAFNLIVEINDEILSNYRNYKDEVADAFSKLVEYTQLNKHIDFNFCQCGNFLNNITGYAKHFCNECNHWICFYCGEDWDISKLNQIGYCNDRCKYYSLLHCELINWARGDALIPSIRFCPKCGMQWGTQGEACKYHTCGHCKYEFCFFCLKQKRDCFSTYRKDPFKRCITPVEQDIVDIFEKNRITKQ